MRCAWTVCPVTGRKAADGKTHCQNANEETDAVYGLGKGP